jgi:hypothetical protein
MSRGGHNWKGGGTLEGTLSLDVMRALPYCRSQAAPTTRPTLGKP